MCQLIKFHLLTAIRGKLISETLYRDIENIIKNDSREFITSEGGEDLLNHQLTNCEIDYDLYCCSDYTKSLCSEIKTKQILWRNYIIFSKH